MFEQKMLVVLGLVVGFAGMGCSKETTSSSNIKTGGIAALIDVYADKATTANVHVELKVGGSDSNTYVALEGGDKLVANAGDQTKTLTATDTGIYDANFSNVDPDTLFTVTLERPSDITAPGNSGTMPASFEIDKPTPSLSRKADDLEITWDADPAKAGDGMDLKFTGTCIFELDKAASDTGSSVVKKGTLDSTGGEMPETCDIALEIQRSRAGEADAAFDPESWFRTHQRRSTKFTSLP
jgi:hypothetical protein